MKYESICGDNITDVCRKMYHKVFRNKKDPIIYTKFNGVTIIMVDEE